MADVVLSHNLSWLTNIKITTVVKEDIFGNMF